MTKFLFRIAVPVLLGAVALSGTALAQSKNTLTLGTTQATSGLQ